MSDAETAALVGATGGAGTTRLCVELAATLARAGEDVAVLDAALATQGLEQYLPGHVERDLTDLLRASDPDPSDCGVDLPVEAPGEITAWPAYAAFEGIARAKAPAAAKRLDDVDATVDCTLENERPGADGSVPDGDATVPESETRTVAAAPVCDDPAPGPFAPAVASAAEALFDCSLSLSFPDDGRFGEDLLPGR